MARKEKALERGQTKEPGSGALIQIADEDRTVEIGPNMVFWIQLDLELTGDRGETGFPSRRAVEDLLTDKRIHIPENRDAARRMLFAIASGRNEGMAEKIEPEKAKTPRGESRKR